MTIRQTFDSFNQFKIVVIGDVMIDSYMWGKVDRISPEAPIPIVTIQNKEDRLGGAANVGLNIKSMGAEPIILSIIGNDNYGDIFLKLLKHEKLSTEGIIESKERITTVKTRILGGNQHLLRVDEEITCDISSELELKLINSFKEIIANNKVNAIIFEDYDKGVITQKIISEIIHLSNERAIPILVDPKKNNFSYYKNIALLKPNFKEFVFGLSAKVEKNDFNEISRLANQYNRENSIESMLITLSEKGVLIANKNTYSHFDALEIDIADVSGAGDTVISLAALCMAAKINMEKLAFIANVAGSLVCEKAGVVQINKQYLLETLEKQANE
ncbi:MAG TPA: D-glycero-beta-D-manno-heptose-7-phosphate kinase [Bacteroidales bacterium]|nr:MAG: hypothetical protein A2W98_13985 [Bacteroidetes bacterium GWF2_33_38]OFY86230.1 MAG: hypothetical protein A2236_13960 [Bacteroidetes bacterium RIFOXYA2_FULL_33_7]HBF89234.1 D-glycero-beta-D-manno-heptose-7-phosphate kinase [Bacteroidales bacterium]